MADNHIDREHTTREKTTRKRAWQRPEVLPSPTPEPGYEFHWVRVATLGQIDATNVSSKLREGWEPVKAEDHPEITMVTIEQEKFKDNVVIGGLMLCKAPKELVEERNDYFSQQSKAQIASVDNNLMRENDPVKMISGSPYIGVTRQYRIASAYGTDIFYGDVVKLVTGGTVERDTADAAMTPIGVFMGCTYTDPSTSQPTFKQYWPASTVASDAMAYVVDATDVLFKVAVISSAASSTIVMADLAITDIGANVQMVDNTGSTVTGNSKIAVDDTSATTNTFPLRVVDVVTETKTSSTAFPEVLVKWCAGHQFDNTTGV